MSASFVAFVASALHIVDLAAITEQKRYAPKTGYTDDSVDYAAYRRARAAEHIRNEIEPEQSYTGPVQCTYNN